MGKVHISHVTPTDFNYDGKMDVVIGGVDDSGNNYLHLHLAGGDQTLEQGYTALVGTSEMPKGLAPVFIDMDGDMRIDMLATSQVVAAHEAMLCSQWCCS